MFIETKIFKVMSRYLIHLFGNDFMLFPKASNTLPVLLLATVKEIA